MVHKRMAQKRKINQSTKDLSPSFIKIRQIVALRGNPELMNAWEKLEPFLSERMDEIPEEFFYICMWPGATKGLELVLDIIGSLAGNLTVDEISKRIVDIAHTKLGFGAALVSIYDEKTNLFYRSAQRGISPDVYEKLVATPVPLDKYKNLMKEEFRISKSYLIRWWHEKELNFDGEFTGRTNIEPGSEWHTDDMLLVPTIGFTGELVGMLSVDNPPGGKIPDITLLNAVEILAAQGGSAIEEAKMNSNIQKKLAQVAFLFEISSAYASFTDEQKFLSALAKNLRESFDYLWTGIFLQSQDTETIYICAQSGLDDSHFVGQKYKIGYKGGIAGEIAATGQPQYVEDISANDRKYTPFHYNAKSQAGIPIRREDRVVGVLVIESEKKYFFSQDEKQFLRTIANLIMSMLTNLANRRSIENELRIRRALFEVGTIINSILEPTRLLRKIIDVLKNTFNYTSAALFLVDETKEFLVMKIFAGKMEHEVDKFKLKIGVEGMVGVVASTGKKLNIPDVSKFPLYVPGFEGVKSALAVPISYRGEILGVLDVESENLNNFTDQDEQLLELFASQIAIAINNSKLYEKLEELATTDGLTGLLNYRTFRENLLREIQRAQRFSYPLSLIFADLDDFKNYNDKFGHLQGDKVLKLFANIILSAIRTDVDIAARYGGEEFTIILPHTTTDNAYIVAERIRKAFIEQSKKNLLIPMSVSMGIAGFPNNAQNADGLIQSADESLYSAKACGKNCVIVAGKKEMKE